eukprot:gene19776-1001_t
MGTPSPMLESLLTLARPQHTVLLSMKDSVLRDKWVIYERYLEYYIYVKHKLKNTSSTISWEARMEMR